MTPKIAWTAAVLALSLLSGAPAQAQTSAVAADGTFAPPAMHCLSGGDDGFNIDLAPINGARPDARMDLVATRGSGKMPGLAAGTGDVVIAPTTSTEKRAGKVPCSAGLPKTASRFTAKADAEEIADLQGFTPRVRRT